MTTPSNAVRDSRIAEVIDALHADARGDWRYFVRLAPRFLLSRATGRNFMPAATPAGAFMAVSRDEGEFLYLLARMTNAQHMVEFGSSFGISTLYLGAAARENHGTLVTSELEPSKCRATEANLRRAGLEDVVTLLEGDALKTLAGGTGAIDLLFLDGAKELYVPLLELLRPRLQPGAVVVADNANMPQTRSYCEHMETRGGAFASTRLFGGRMLLSRLAESPA